MSQLEFDGLASAVAAEDGMSNALNADRVTMWKAAADAWLYRLDQGREFVTDDMVAVVGLPDEGPNRNNVVGAWTSAQARRGHIRFAGRMRKSKRVARHVGLQRVWVKT